VVSPMKSPDFRGLLRRSTVGHREARVQKSARSLHDADNCSGTLWQ
jgi:hypothetical protein